MAISGLYLVFFVLFHMYGNLKLFAGQAAFDDYAHHLRTMFMPILPHSGFLWIFRLTLLVAVVAHVWAAIQLTGRAHAARKDRYVVKRTVRATLASRTMRWGGVALLLFIIWHLINFTIGKVNVAGGATNDPFNLLFDTFDVWWMTIIYLLAMLALGLHLHHGTWSSMQTLGLTGTATARRNAKLAGWAVAIVIAGGFSIVPLAVLTGVITK